MKQMPHRFSATFLTVAVATLLTVLTLSSQSAQEEKVSVGVSDLPAAITKAIQTSVPAGQILEIEKEVQGENPGQYDVIVLSDGNQYEIEISPEGKVLEKKKTAADEKSEESEKKWTSSFGMKHCTFRSAGRNRFFILEPGYQLVLASDSEKVVITVLEKTKKIGKVETRIIEEREEEDGELKEVSRNFFAICKEHGDIFYFGEEVDDYEAGKITAHSGAWRADGKDSQAGIIMPGTILLGARHYQEIAPNAMDRAEILRDDVTFHTPAGTFENCLQVEETSGIDPSDKSSKTYAPGIGLIQDEDMVLIRYGKAVK